MASGVESLLVVVASPSLWALVLGAEVVLNLEQVGEATRQQRVQAASCFQPSSCHKA